MSEDAQCGAVILIGFGGPASPGEIRPFLDRVTAGRPIPRERYEDVVHHYEAIGGRSPFNEITRRQASALGAQLVRVGVKLPVVLGMRNTPPWLERHASRAWAKRRAPRVGLRARGPAM